MPPNYRCSGAEQVSKFPFHVVDSTQFVYSSLGSCEHGERKGLWYYFHSTAGFVYEISTCFDTTDFAIVIEVYYACSPTDGGFNCAGFVDDKLCPPRAHMKILETNSWGSTFFVYITGANSETGTFELEILEHRPTLHSSSSEMQLPSSSSEVLPSSSTSKEQSSTSSSEAQLPSSSSEAQLPSRSSDESSSSSKELRSSSSSVVQLSSSSSVGQQSSSPSVAQHSSSSSVVQQSSSSNRELSSSSSKEQRSSSSSKMSSSSNVQPSSSSGPLLPSGSSGTQLVSSSSSVQQPLSSSEPQTTPSSSAVLLPSNSSSSSGALLPSSSSGAQLVLSSSKDNKKHLGIAIALGTVVPVLLCVVLTVICAAVYYHVKRLSNVYAPLLNTQKADCDRGHPSIT
eukprot:TRINITY_DN5202_c0_g1_i1.p1 TRINITY_DN5202_c0_g1~~TRINITY_DN5202_c0_g1_i1.p1  ORF type:complete len:398 (-),score=32.06 TRINITY_DN5202_c0_g1_i1:74-1267(-)